VNKKERYTKEKFLEELNEALNEFNAQPAQKPNLMEMLKAKKGLAKNGD